MFCGNCGRQIEDTSNVCPYCGVMVERQVEVGNGSRYARIFVEPNENYIASLGNGYINSFLTAQKINRCVGILSDKRVYLRGNMIDINNGKIERINMQKTLDLEDITGTGFIYASPQIWKLILALFTAFTVIPAILLIVSYLKNRDTLFFIEYAGGCIKFNASIYGLPESQDFEKQIRRAKDKVKEVK
jgi:hypothetical protein